MLSKRTLSAAVLLAALTATTAAGAGPKASGTRFWNLTGETVTKLELAPAGTSSFGPNLCAGDKDGAVDNDERLKVEGIASGTYDARVTDAKGRVCMATAIEVKDGAVFSIESDQLKDCKP